MGEDNQAPGSSWWKTPDQRGAELLQSGDAAGASHVFRDSRWRGVSQYRNGNFAEAQKEFSTGADPTSLYNAGTAAARAGDYETAIEKFEQVMEADPNHLDAAHNLDISRQLREKQQQSSDQQGDSGDGDDSEQSEDSESQQDGQQQDGQQQDGEQGQQSEQQSGNSEQNTDENNSQDGQGELSTDADDAKEAQRDAEQQTATEQTATEQTATEQTATEQSADSEPAGQQVQSETEQAQQSGAEQEQAEPAEPGDANRTAESARREPISESEQATEQWMRRIPDDPSQLLRNKIKLNHMIQHENVTDLPEPW